eukprot:gene5652-9468_t
MKRKQNVLETCVKSVAIKNIPTSFQNDSGVFLWGQLHCIIEGSKNSAFDSAKPVSSSSGGTILQSQWNYRVKAKKGTWIVTEGLMDDDFFGYIIHHESVKAIDVLKKAHAVGVDHQNKSKEVAYVNRYDWSVHHGSVDAIRNEIKQDQRKRKKNERDDSDDENHQLMYGRMYLIDSSIYQSFLKCVEKKKTHHKNELFQENRSNLGIHLTDEFTEYELGWMIFDTNSKENELIGFVYDATYHGLGDGTPGVK